MAKRKKRWKFISTGLSLRADETKPSVRCVETWIAGGRGSSLSPVKFTANDRWRRPRTHPAAADRRGAPKSEILRPSAMQTNRHRRTTPLDLVRLILATTDKPQALV